MIIAAQDKIAVIQSNIESLRGEIKLRIESQTNLWRVSIAGLAAVVVLKSEADIGPFLPVVPIVGMLITAYWFSETLFVFRTGRWIASMEAQINTLLGAEILRYESIMWEQRKATLWGTTWFYVVIAITTTAIYGLLLYVLLPVAKRASVAGLVELFVAAAFLSYIFAAVNLYRIWNLLRQP